MFLSKVNKVGKTSKIVSKTTGKVVKVRMLAKSIFSSKKDVFIIEGKTVVWRDSIRRRYNVS